MFDDSENKQIIDSQNNEEQNFIPNYSSENTVIKKKHLKPIILSAIAIVIVFGVVFVSFGFENLFKSNTEIVFSAYSNSLNKYLDNNYHKTFLSQIFDIKKSNDAQKDSKFNFGTSIAINKIKDTPYLNGAKLNLNMNIDQENQECDLNFDGKFNGIEISNAEAYFNTEECIFKIPSLAEDKSFYINIKDLLKSYSPLFSNNFSMKYIFENLKNSYTNRMKSLFDLSKEINAEFISNVNMEVAEPIIFNGHNLDTYKCVLNNDEVKQLLKNIFPKIIENDFFKETIKNQLQGYDESYSYEDFKQNFNNNINSMIDSLVDIDNITILAGVNNKDLIKLEITINLSEKESVVFEIKFIGEKDPSDIFDSNFMYKKNGQEKFNIVFTDTTIDSDEGVNNSKIFTISSDNGKNQLQTENSVNFETFYNDSSNEFSGKLTFIDNDVPNTIDFNGTVKNDEKLLNLDFKNILFKKSSDVYADISFSLKTEEFKGIKRKEKDNVIDIIKNPEEFMYILQNFT